MSELWEVDKKPVAFIELVGLIERSDFYQVGFIAYTGDKKNSIDVHLTKDGKRCFNFETLKVITMAEAMKIAREADSLILRVHQTIFDEADARKNILQECLEMEYVTIQINGDLYQKLDDGLWEIGGDDENIVPSTTVYHDMFDFTKIVTLVKY